MNLKLTSSIAGDRFTFPGGRVIECSDEAGERLIKHGMAVEAPEGAQPEGRMPDGEPGKRLRKEPERAVARPAETPEKGEPTAHCKGTTNRGNPCLKAPVQGGEFCIKHSPPPEAA